MAEATDAKMFIDLGTDGERVILRLVEGEREMLMPMSIDRACQVATGLVQICGFIDPEADLRPGIDAQFVAAGQALNAHGGERP